MSGKLITIKKYIKSNRGTSMVEFALVLPVLMLLFGGIIDLGYMMHQYLVIEEVARVGARSAEINLDDVEAKKNALAVVGKNNNWGIDVKFSPERPPGSDQLKGPVKPKDVTVTVLCKRIELHGLIDVVLTEKLRADFEELTTKVVARTQEIL